MSFQLSWWFFKSETMNNSYSVLIRKVKIDHIIKTSFICFLALFVFTQNTIAEENLVLEISSEIPIEAEFAGIEMANTILDFESITKTDIEFEPLSVDPLDAGDITGILAVGDIIGYQTNGGRYGKFQIMQVDNADNYRLFVLHWPDVYESVKP